jgi:hypothetical protein
VLAEVAAAVPAHAGSAALIEARRTAQAEASAARPGRGAPAGAEAEAGARAGPGAPPAGARVRAAEPAPPAGDGAPSPPAELDERRGDPAAVGAPAAIGAPAPAPAQAHAGASAPPAARAAPGPHAAEVAEPPSPRAAEVAEPAPPPIAGGVAVATRYAGLFYLIGRVLEIDLAEALWAAGVTEGDVLAHVAAAILDDDADPAWRWFGGAFDRAPRLPALPAWAIGEVSAAVQHGLGRRLVAFGVAHTPDALGAELDELAAAVPRPAAGDAATARVVARAAAAMAILTAARLGRPPAWPLLHEVVTRPGRLVVTADAVRVILSAALVDVDHRRAGLDHDPGHAPWLGRRVVLEFAGGEAL